jgi:anaerobic ribonucleoside-triphosphate reductase
MNKIEKEIEEIKEKLNDPFLCEGTAMTYTRITGYYRPVEFFNTGKAQEFVERLPYLLKTTLGSEN